jgi:alpha-galactosidase
MCNPPEIWQMVDEMLVAQAPWLPQYKEAIKAAKARLKKGKAIKTNETYKGAARIKTKTIDEMRQDRAAANKLLEADKAKDRPASAKTKKAVKKASLTGPTTQL